MKKVKVTKRPSRTDAVLYPSRLRMFLIYIIFFVIAIAAGLMIRAFVTGSSLVKVFSEGMDPITGAFIVGASAVLAFIERSRWILRVVGGEKLEGPVGYFGDRLGIPLKEIDWTRTRRSLSSRLKVGNAIYGSMRQRILVSPWFYSPGAFNEFISKIGYEKDAHADA